MLRLWLKRLPDAVSQREAAVVLTVAVVLFVLVVLSVDVMCLCVCRLCRPRCDSRLLKLGERKTRRVSQLLGGCCLLGAR